MMKMTHLFFVTGFIISILSPQYSFAETVGIAPPKDIITIYQGDVLHESVTLSRGDASHTLALSVSQVPPSPLINIHGQKDLSIPEGSQMLKFFYDVDATAIALGEYDEMLQFVVVPASIAPQQESVGQIVYGITEKIHISVVARPDPSKTIAINEYPSLLSDVAVSSITSRQDFQSPGGKVSLTWALNNGGNNPLSGVETTVSITRDANQFFRTTLPAADVIDSHGSLKQSTDFTLDYSAPSGRYDIAIIVGDHTVHQSFLFIQRMVLLKIIAGISGIAFCILGILFIRTVQKKKTVNAKKKLSQ